MGVGQLTGDIRGRVRDQRRIGAKQRQEDRHAEQIEKHVPSGGLLGRPARTKRGDDGGDRRAQIVAQQDGDGRLKRQQPLHGHGDGEADRGRTRLHGHGQQRAGGDAQQRMSGEGEKKLFVGGEKAERVLHRAHADEEQPEAEDAVADVAAFFRVAEDGQQHADAQQRQRQLAHVEGDQLRRDGGADVGSHDHAERLLQRHHPRLHEAHRHDRRGGARLDHHRYQRADQRALERRARQRRDQRAHAVARQILKGVAHQFDAVQEQPDAAHDLEQSAQVHSLPPVFIKKMPLS